MVSKCIHIFYTKLMKLLDPNIISYLIMNNLSIKYNLINT